MSGVGMSGSNHVVWPERSIGAYNRSGAGFCSFFCSLLSSTLRSLLLSVKLASHFISQAWPGASARKRRRWFCSNDGDSPIRPFA